MIAALLADALITKCGALQLVITTKTGNGDFVQERVTVFFLSPLTNLVMPLDWIIPESQELSCIQGMQKNYILDSDSALFSVAKAK